jgi:flagellar biosynthesis/type III secretory pathway protein FliH
MNALTCRVSQLPDQVHVMHWGIDALGEPARDAPRKPVNAKAERETRHTQSLLSELTAAVEELEQRRSHSFHELQHLAIDLAVTIASAVAQCAIEREEHGVETLVQQAMKRMGVADGLIVGLHPGDAKRLTDLLKAENRSWPTNTLAIVPDDSLEPGSVRITRDGTGLLSRVQSRLSDIRRHLIEGLDDAQIERRNAPGTDSLLRRFPDRRSSA